jgi:hypothetical protein
MDTWIIKKNTELSNVWRSINPGHLLNPVTSDTRPSSRGKYVRGKRKNPDPKRPRGKHKSVVKYGESIENNDL